MNADDKVQKVKDVSSIKVNILVIFLCAFLLHSCGDKYEGPCFYFTDLVGEWEDSPNVFPFNLTADQLICNATFGGTYIKAQRVSNTSFFIQDYGADSTCITPVTGDYLTIDFKDINTIDVVIFTGGALLHQDEYEREIK